jgi:hypothetical protein
VHSDHRDLAEPHSKWAIDIGIDIGKVSVILSTVLVKFNVQNIADEIDNLCFQLPDRFPDYKQQMQNSSRSNTYIFLDFVP